MSKQRKPAEDASEPEQRSVLRPPVPVQVAFWIWIASAALRLVNAVVIGHLFARSQFDQYGRLLVVSIVELVLLAALYVFFAYKVQSGRNWARMTMTVLVIIAIVIDAWNRTLFSNGDWVGLLISAVAVILVYFPSANAYFAARKRLG